MQILAIAVALSGLISATLGWVLTIRNIKKTGPSEELRTWRKEVDVKLDSDLRRLQRLERDMDERREFERIMLHCMKGILGHLVDGNHTGAMKELVGKIDAFLIAR